MNTLLAPAAGAVTSLLFRNYISGDRNEKKFNILNDATFDAGALIIGVLCGLVAITGNCAFVEYWAAIVIGGTSSFIYALSVRLLNHMEIDDPTETMSVHGACGMWGILMAGLFHVKCGAFYRVPISIPKQMLGVVVVFGWNVIWGALLMGVMLLISRKYTRLSDDEEKDMEQLPQGIKD